MSYFEMRPVLVDTSAETRIEARMGSGERDQPVVRVTVEDETRRNVLDIDVKDWRAFARAVEGMIRKEAREG